MTKDKPDPTRRQAVAILLGRAGVRRLGLV